MVFGLILVGMTGIITALVPAPALAAAGINKTIGFQGRLLTATGAVVPDGNYNLKFKIYQDGSGRLASDAVDGATPAGTLMWTELWQNSVATGSSSGVTVKNGYFSVTLGTYCVLAGSSCQGNSNTGVSFNQDTLWLSMDVGGTAVSNTPTYDGEMLPMKRLTSAVYALQADNANTLGGLTSSGFIQNTATVQTNANIAIQSVADASVTLLLKERATQSADILRVTDSSNVLIFDIDTFGKLHQAYAATFDGAVGIGMASSSGEQLRVAVASASTVGFAVYGSTGQTADLINVDAEGTKALNYTGAGTLAVTAGSGQTADLLQVKDTTGANLLKVDSGGNQEGTGYINNGYGGVGQFGNLLTYSEQFDNGAWTKTSVTAPTADTIVALDGQTTAESLADSGSGGSVSQTSGTAPTNANYTFSVWLKTASGTQPADLRIDGATTGTGTKVTVTATSTWQRFSVTQNTNGFTGNIKPLIFPGGTAGSGTVHAWGAQLVLASVPQVYVRATATTVAAGQGVVSNGGAFISSLNATDIPLVVQGSPSQSGDLLQLQNSSATSLFKVGAVGGLTIAEASFGAGAAPVALSVTGAGGGTGVTGGAGGAISLVTGNGANGTTNGGAGGAVTITAGNGGSNSANGAGGTITLAAGNGGTTAVSGGNGGSVILQGGAAQGGGTVGKVLVKPLANADSTAAFQVQKAGGAAMFAVDTTNQAVIVGTPAGDSVGTVLQLGVKSNAGDPAGGYVVDGAIYYNSSTDSFRCYNNSFWVSCIGGMRYSQTSQGGASNNPPAGDTVGNTTTATTFAESYSVPANDCIPGRVYRITAGGLWGDAATSVFTLKVLWGATTVAVTDAGATLNYASQTAQYWHAQIMLTCFTNASAVTAIEATGQVFFNANNVGQVMGIGTSVKGQAVTTNSSQTLKLQVTWANLSASNTITLRTYVVESMGP
ncbi:MAG: exported protein of unknown function [Patescibacteria group bacterium]|nr:exported protein of unknown function [Patescibacteria group bacterium]